jgi:hypothetical protein
VITELLLKNLRGEAKREAYFGCQRNHQTSVIYEEARLVDDENMPVSIKCNDIIISLSNKVSSLMNRSLIEHGIVDEPKILQLDQDQEGFRYMGVIYIQSKLTQEEIWNNL